MFLSVEKKIFSTRFQLVFSQLPRSCWTTRTMRRCFCACVLCPFERENVRRWSESVGNRRRSLLIIAGQSHHYQHRDQTIYHSKLQSCLKISKSIIEYGLLIFASLLFRYTSETLRHWDSNTKKLRNSEALRHWDSITRLWESETLSSL